ncbi:MAG: lipid A biosynthesis acyltransferase [Bacteroidales bacterium]|nr:lipid A biosynthesis acyltransferase [Bacteroidales bacterium]
MDKLIYFFFKAFIIVFRVLPFRLLYGFSDFLFYIIYGVIRYRRDVVLSNLKRSFPEKSEEEITSIAKKFYHHLCDLLIESLKSFTMKEEELVKRYRFTGIEILSDFFENGRSVICVAGHYGNWEWGGEASGSQVKHKPIGFYKPLSNKYIDDFVQKIRVKGRTRLASIARTAETFNTNWDEPVLYFMVADQCPSSTRLAFWLDFLNQDTAVLHGPEKYARIHNLPVVFAWPRKLKRGHYSVEFKMLAPDPSKTKTGEITTRFMNMLEEVIKENPQYYLWSHKRWKLKR